MRGGVIILVVFGAVWGLFALWSLDAPRFLFALPPIVSISMLGLGWSSVSSSVGNPHYRRVVRFWSLIEGAAMIVAAIALQRWHAQEYIPSAFCVIVGLHFFPLARSFPQPLYYGSGAAMTVAGALSIALPSPQLQAVVASSAAALILWASAIAVIISAKRLSDASLRAAGSSAL